MAELIHGLDAERVRANLEAVRAEIAAACERAGRDAGAVEIHDTGLCTMCAPDGLLWSFRRDGDRAGRQGGVAWRS